MMLVALLGVLAAQGARPAIDPARAAEVFAELEEAVLADGGELWGQELIGPVLLADTATRAVVANQPDERGLLVERDAVFTGTLPAEIGLANTAVEWAGVRWTMVMWPLPAERHARVRLLVHESFHRIQPRLGHGGGDRPSAHLDTEAGRTWLRMEMRALAAALGAADSTGDARRAACADALVFRAHRRALFAGAAELESAFERQEGLPEYTGYVLCGLDAAGRDAAAAAKLRADDGKPSFVRSFAYATGPAYGLLLDALAPAWRAGIGPTSDLGALLAAALAWTPPAELAAEAERRGAFHGLAEVAADERARAEERAAREARHRARYVDGPVLVLPFGPGMRYSFDFDALVPLEGVGDVFGSVYATDEWGVLDATGGALFVRGAQGQILEARVPAPSELGTDPLAGDGWTLALADGWELVPDARPGDLRVVRAR